MTTYSAVGPDGHTYTLEGPAGASDADVMTELQRQYEAQQKASKPGMLESAGAGIVGGLAKMGLGTAAAAADYTGHKDTAASLDAKRKAVEEWQAQHGSNTLTGQASDIVGASAPAMGVGAVGTALAPVTGGLSLVAAEAVNAGLFGIPAFRDEYNAQKAAGASEAAAISHAAWQAGLATVGARVVSSGGKLLPGVAKAGEGLLGKVATAGAEGAALPVAGRIGDKAISAANDQADDRTWMPSKQEVLASAAGFGALGGAHHLMNAPAEARAAADKKAADDAAATKAATDAQTAADAQAAQEAAAKQTPEYLHDLDARYQAYRQQAADKTAALGPKPKAGDDPSAALAWKAKRDALTTELQDPAFAELTNEHAARRDDIEALKVQEDQAAAAAEQSRQTAAEAGADQVDTRTPADTGPSAPNAQPDLFAEGQTAPSSTPTAEPPQAVPLEQQIQQASQALVDHENAIDALRDKAKQAVADGDMDAVLRHSAQANDLGKQLKPLQDALEKLKLQHPPEIEARLRSLQNQLGAAAEVGDTAKLAKLAAQIKEMQSQSQPTLTSKDNMARVAAGDNALAGDMASGAEAARAQRQGVESEVAGIQRIADNAKQPSETLAVKNLQAKEDQANPPSHPVQQEPLQGEAETPGTRSDATVAGAVDKLTDTLVDPATAAREQQIRELKREQAQHHSIGREDLAAGLQTRITALESQGRINPHDADTVDKVDSLHRELEQANNAVEHARVTRNAKDAEAAGLKARQIADQLAAVQAEPGSFAGRLVKAKNDVSHTLTAFFDAAHEIHTSGLGQRLRDKHFDLQAQLRDMNRPPASQNDVAVHAAKRGEIERQMSALQRQLGAVNTETPTRKLEAMARQAVNKYIRSAFREENIRREARQQKPLTGAERAAFAKKAQLQAEALLTRVKADRGGDYMQEHVVQPAQMRSGKVVKNAVTEWRDTRPLEERPLAKFGAARAVEEEVFHKERAESLQSKQKPQRVEGDGLKRQWQAAEETKRADERGDNFKTLTGQQRRRAEYLRVQMSHIDSPKIQELQDALAQYPTNRVMDIIEPMLHEARTGRDPEAGTRKPGFFRSDVELPNADLNRLREAVALEKEVAQDKTGQGDLFSPKTAIMEQSHIEDKQEANEQRAGELSGKYNSLEDAAKAAKERGTLEADTARLEQDKQRSKDDEHVLKGEAARMSTSFERTTPARFANAPEVKAGRAAADEQAKLTQDIHDQLEGFVAAENKPTWFSKLTERLASLQDQLASFKKSRPFADMGRMQRRDIPELLEKDTTKFKRQDSADIIFQLANYNKFVDDTNAFLAQHRGTNSPEYHRLVGEIENMQRAIRSMPSDTELVAARRTVDEQRRALTNLLAKPEPAQPAGRAARAKNIEASRAALDMAEGILRLKETTPRLTPDVEGRREQRKLAEESGVKVRAATAAEMGKRAADMDAAVEERMRLEEAARRLAKLPATRVSTDAESQYSALLRSGLRKEAAGIEAKLATIDAIIHDPAYFDKAEQKIKDAQAAGTAAYRIDKMKRQLADARSLDATESGREKWARLLEKSNTTYEQLDSLLPKKVERLNEEGTSEKDDVLQPATPTKAQQKRIDAAIAAAEKQNERALAKGRPQTVRSTAISHNKVSTVRGEKTITTSQAVRAANTDQATHDARIHAAEARVAHIEGLQEKNAAALAAAKGRDAKAKYEGYEARLEAAHADVSAQLARAQELAGKDIVGDEAANKFSERVSTDLAPEAVDAAHDGRILDVAKDIAENGSTPEIRAAAAKLQPLLMRTKMRVDENVTHNGESVAGKYDPAENTITMHPEGLTEQDVIHEMTHAATDRALLADISTLTPTQREGRTGLENMWTGIQHHPDFIGEHGATTVREFAAEVYSNAEFRAKLDAIGKPLTLLERFKNLVRKILGMPTSPSGRAKDFVDQVMQQSGKISAKAAPSLFRKKQEYTSEAAKFGRDISQNRSVTQDIKATGFSKIAMAAEQKIVDSRASLRYAAKIGDKKTGTQVLGDILSADATIQNAMRVADNGAFVLGKDQKGFVTMKAGGGANAKDVMAKIDKLPGGTADEKVDLFQGYMTALRAQDVGWHVLDYSDPAGMQRRGEAVIREVQSNPTLKAAMDQAQDAYHEYNKGLVKFLKDTHAIPEEVADKMMADRNYIPMFRNRGDNLDLVMQNGKAMSVGDVRTLPFLHALNGGAEKLMPFEEALFKNTAMLTQLGVQNMASRHIAYHLQGLGGSMKIQRGDGGAARGGTTLRFRDKPQGPNDDGERHLVIDTKGTAAEHIPTDLLTQAVAGSYASIPSLLKVGKFASDILRAGVTRMPTYMTSQLIKDPMNASMLGNLKADPATATLKTINGFYEHLSGKSADDNLLSDHGVLHSNVFSGDVTDFKKALLQMGGARQSTYKQALAKLDKFAMSADAATRIQAYRDVIKAGGSELEAVIHAREMQNFNKHGSSQSMQLISRMVPFFNAQIQGLNVMLKSATGGMPANDLLNTKSEFFKRALGMSAMSLLLASQLEDDPEWNKMSLKSKASYIPMGGLEVNGEKIRIPAPFESGMAFYSLPIIFMEALKRNFSDNDWQDVRDVLKNQLPGNGSIVPQAAKGYLDVSRNYNSAFGSPIESPGMLTKDATERYTAGTPEAMKEFSRRLKDMGVSLSPVQIDYLSNAYLGQFPHLVGMLTNHLFATRDVGEAPEKNLHEDPLVGRFFENGNESRNVNDAYDRAKQAKMTDATVKAMVKDGRGEEARVYQREQAAQYGTPQQARLFENQMGFMRRQEDAINGDKTLSGEAKQQRLNALAQRKDRAAANWLKNAGQAQ